MRRFGRLVGRCVMLLISLEYSLYEVISEQDDEALWNAWASTTLYRPDRTPSEEEKKMRVQRLLSIGSGRAGAIEYLKFVKRSIHRDAPQMGVRPSYRALFLYF